MLVAQIENPVVMETHGGVGKIYNKCYSDLAPGVVFEKNRKKCEFLVKQRPSWAVYCVDSEKALIAGVGFHLPVNFFDVDPYGDPWPTINAIFDNKDNLPAKFGLVVNDGLKRFLMMGRGWASKSLAGWVEKVGNKGMAENYAKIVKEEITNRVNKINGEIKKWALHSSGHGGQMTHYAAVLVRK